MEFDPTTENLAEDEEFRYLGVDPAIFEKLMREILENRYSMKEKEIIDGAEYIPDGNSITKNVYKLLRNNRLPLLVFICIALSLYIRCGLYFSVLLTRNPRKKSIRYFKHAVRLLRLAGFRRGNGLTAGLSEPEWALHIEFPIFLQRKCPALAAHNGLDFSLILNITRKIINSIFFNWAYHGFSKQFAASRGAE